MICATLLFALPGGAPAQSAPPQQADKETMMLHQGWQFRRAGEGAWHRATVPGCVHTDLLANGLIEDPF
ncbi:glycosyl hydrolase 2 galactose-binding domain-containing protein, partial [Staphylococcus aureus]|uniref:glycosyl hydrolase 2 galactose-binding domain-containing protein n=1 Tax=Staphylococcus aureus TaxID=1280 RepID=UPI003C6F3FED